MITNKVFKKAVAGIISAMVFIVVGFVLIYIVFRPILWLANMLGRIGFQPV